jgi:hypothetical protein
LNVQAVPPGHTPPPQVASHGAFCGTHTQSLKKVPSRNGAHVLPAAHVPLQVGNPVPPLHGTAAWQKHSFGKLMSTPQACDTGQAPGQVAVGAPGTQTLSSSTHAHRFDVDPPLAMLVA